ncbi:MAG: DUF4832 domain-containing protein [Kiritimatiellae bacterium]|nr:DUF4832 domain-containing protein [Kiritimatiellia bacterium]
MRSINNTRFNAGRIYGVFAAFACLVAANAAVVEPKATDEILCNPGMGFFHFCYSGRLWAYGGELKPGDTLDWMPGTTVTYMRLPWSYLEPEEGVYRWDLFEAKARPWLAAGKKLGFRISCMNISIASTPQWVLDAGAKGVWRDYSNTGTKSMVWEPVWDDPVYLAKYENFLKAFAERYDGNPDVAFVDLGSFGKFGEGHSDILNKMRSSSDPAQRKEYERICKLHIDLLRRCLPNTYLVVSDDIGGGGWMKDPKTGKPIADHPIFEYCRSLGIGLRDDSIMCAPPPNHWASAHFGRKFAETTPVIIETGQITRRLEKGIWDPEKLLLCLEDYHASYLGVHGFPDLCWEKNKHVWRKTANRMGYRFELRRVEYPDAVKVSEPVVIRSTWVNTGVAPQYANSSLTWNLLNDEGVVCWSVTDTRVGMRSLAPKWDGVEKPQTLESRCTFGYTAPVPDGGKDVILNWCRKHHRNDPGEIIELLKPGTYTLAVSVGRKDGKPEIALPLAGGVNRVYPIGKIVVR